MPINIRLKVDGKLDETVWNQAKEITDFVQIEPNQKAPPNQKTVSSYCITLIICTLMMISEQNYQTMG